MKKKIINRSIIGWMWHAAGKMRYMVFVFAIFEMTLSAVSVGMAKVMQGMVDGATTRNGEQFWFFVKIYAAVTIGRLLFDAFYRYIYALTGSALYKRFQGRLFSVLLKKDYGAVTAMHSGEMLTRLNSDTSLVTSDFLYLVPSLLGLLVQFCGALWMVLQMLPGVVYLVLPGGLVMILASWSLRKIMKQMHKDVQEASGRLTTFFTDRITSMMVIRAFGKEDSTTQDADEQMNDFRRVTLRRSHFSNFCSLCFSGGVYFIYLLCTIYGGYCILNDSMTYGTFTAMLQLVNQIQGPLSSVSGYLPKYYSMVASAERLIEVENFADDCENGVLDEAEIRRFYEELTELGTENLSFTYPAKEGENPVVLSGLNLSIRKGEYVAFTGHSGCGKSTVLKLLMALYHPNAGQCYYSCQEDAHTLDSRYRGLFAYVPQGNQLMSGTIRDVVTFGSRTPDEKKLRQALDIACASEFIYGLENGLDSKLGERGSGLSEGQMQRIAIARAIYSDRPILLLDEATSSLDEATERQVLVNLRQITDKTVLIITHRPAALEICDKIIPFEGGEE